MSFHHVPRGLSCLASLDLGLLVVPVPAVHPLHDPHGLLPLPALHVAAGSHQEGGQTGLVQGQGLLAVLHTAVRPRQLGVELRPLRQQVGVGSLVPRVDLEGLAQTSLRVLQSSFSLRLTGQLSLLFKLSGFEEQSLGSLMILVDLENLRQTKCYMGTLPTAN